MSSAENFLKDARTSFQLASDAILAKDMERYAGMGLDYLELAHQASEIIDGKPTPAFWRLP
jgi:hypothetical protein